MNLSLRETVWISLEYGQSVAVISQDRLDYTVIINNSQISRLTTAKIYFLLKPHTHLGSAVLSPTLLFLTLGPELMKQPSVERSWRHDRKRREHGKCKLAWNVSRLRETTLITHTCINYLSLHSKSLQEIGA